MHNVIPKNTRVIKATFKNEPLKHLGTLILMPAKCSNGWVAQLKNGTWGNILTSYLEDSDMCDIQCFNSFNEYHKVEKI